MATHALIVKKGISNMATVSVLSGEQGKAKICHD